MPVDLPSAPPAPRGPFILSGRIVLACMVGFFCVVAGVNGLMMTMAIRTMPGADVRNAYETSQRFNDEIARMHEQDARGWRAEAHLARTDDQTTIALALSDRDGAPIRGLSIEARLQHPATRQQDHEILLREEAPGRYGARLANLHSGNWTLEILAKRDGEPVYVSRSRIHLKD